MADHGYKLPTTTLNASDYVRVRNSNRLGDIFNSDTPTVHTLVGFKTFGCAKVFKPKKLGVTFTPITLEPSVFHGNLPIACNGIEYIPNKLRLVLADHHYS